MNNNVLFVDDDLNILAAYKRTMRKFFNISTASSGAKGLKLIKQLGPFAVVVSDKNMPEMNGIDFLTKVKEEHPNTVRIMLTGKANLESAIHAVNDGRIFRFLTKPCSAKFLSNSVLDGIKQYQLLTAEKELLEQTLFESINVLSEILSLVNPIAFSRASRIRRYVQDVAKEMNLANIWQFKIAAMLSQIGCITLPAELLDKVFVDEKLSEYEAELYSKHPSVGSNLVKEIPRLELVTKMIEFQQKPYREFLKHNLTDKEKSVNIGAQILKVMLDFDKLLMQGKSSLNAVSHLRQINKENDYNPAVINALENLPLHQFDRITKTIKAADLRNSMIIDQDVKGVNGVLLVPKGQLVTNTVLELVKSFSKRIGVKEPFRVQILQ
ncbi:MAG: response regulator [Candidatus Cloacimonadota bacterium]|nr:response regulator [Candidatus Cloacimonadota bacterium]